MPPGPTPTSRRLPSASSSSTRSRAPTAIVSTQRMRRPPGRLRACMRRDIHPATKISATTATRLSSTRISSPPTLTSAAGSATGANATNLRPIPALFTARLPQLPHALGGADHVGQADAELLVDHHHLAMRDQGAVDEHVQRFAGGAVEFHHRALVELQQVADADARAADLHRQGHRHVEDHVEIDLAGARGGAAQRIELDAFADVVGKGFGGLVHAISSRLDRSPPVRTSRRPTWLWKRMALRPLAWP